VDQPPPPLGGDASGNHPSEPPFRAILPTVGRARAPLDDAAVRRLLVAVAAFAALAVAVPSWAAAAPSPAGLTAVALDASVDLAWQPVASAATYNVYRGTSAATVTTLVSPFGVAVTGFKDTSAVNGTTYYYAVKPVVSGAELGSSAVVQTIPRARSCSAGNPVVLENCFPGVNGWDAQFPAAGSATGIEGFTTASSIDRTGSVDLKVASSASFRAEIYRSGWYGGLGARLISTVLDVPPVVQPTCASDASTGLVDCSNWSSSLTLTTSASWPSGVYLIRLVRNDNGADTLLVLVVRDDARNASLLYGVPFSTYEAYNNYGGKSLYTFNSTGANTASGTPRAVKISFDRPFIQPLDSTRPDWYPRSDYPFVSWLERSGYDVSYGSSSDLERHPAGTHKAYISGAHDEYWSAAMRSALEAARGAGTSIFFSGANALYWRIRYESGPNGGEDRVEVCYKSVEGLNAARDPVSPTSTWRDSGGPNNPENALVGQMYTGDGGLYFPLVVGAAEGSDRIWRYTALNAQAPGASTSIGTGLVGWEWDRRAANGFEPVGVKTLATSPVSGNIVQNDGGNYVSGSTTSNVTKYNAGAALVFSTGTNQWGRGLALNAGGAGEPDVRIQQATTNVLADMGAAPQTPAANISLDDAAAPRVASGSPADGATNVGRTVAPAATFSRAMDASTITSSSFTLQKNDGTRVAATVSYDAATSTATLTPAAVLDYSTTYTARLGTSVKAADGAPLQFVATWTFTTLAQQLPVRVNAGGAAYTAGDGRAFLADTYFTGGSTNASGQPIGGTSDAKLYQDERWGQFNYAIPVVNGTYDVTFHFVELYYGSVIPGACAGKRVFSLDVLDTSGPPDVSNLDVCAQAGGPNIALAVTLYGVNVSDGFLNVQSVYGAADDPEVAAIEVVPSTGPPPAPTLTARTPAPGATGVSTTAPVTATFSRAMTASSIGTSSFTLTGPGGAVAAGVAYDATTRVATMTPAAALAGSTTYTATLASTIKAQDGTPLAGPVSWSFTTAAPGAAAPVRVNTGGAAFTSGDGRSFLADKYFTGGSTYASTSAIGGTPDPALYQNERWGTFSYAIPVVNGTYDVKLHFVELYYGTAVAGSCVGKRVFSIDLGDTPGTDVPNLDVCAAAGGPNTALVKTISGVTVSDGFLNIQSIYGAADDPEIAAIEVVPSGPPDAQAPTTPGNLTAAGSLGRAALSWQASTDNVGVVKYDVYRSTTSGFTPSTANRIAQPTGTSYTDTAVAAGTSYYVVKAEDAAGNLSPASNEAAATVTSDTTPPAVTLTAPAGGTTVSGTTAVSATASDDVGVAGVQFKVDGQNVGAEDTTAPYSVSWSTASTTNGTHDLTAVARDAAGNRTTSTVVTVTVSNTAGPTGLVAAYSFDAGSGTTVADLSGNGNTGTLTNATWTTAGHTAGALSFNGTNALVTVPDSASLDLTVGMTLEAWVNTTALGATWRTVVLKEQPGNLAYALYANAETARPSTHVFVPTGEAILKGTAGLTLNTWAHLAASYDGATLRLYVNGTQVASTAVSGAMATTTGSLRIGGNTVWGEWFKGLIDDVRVYNRALSAAEVQADMGTPVH
jgi:fibronectin type 3 domain-containing protein